MFAGDQDFAVDHAAETCPACKEDVVFDYVHGVSACERCGRVVQESELVASAFERGLPGPARVFVGARDSGAAAAAMMSPGTGPSKALQRARPDEALIKMQRALRDLAARLALPPALRSQAELFVEQLTPLVAGAWPREHLAAAAAYAAIRLNHAPLTLLDVADVLQADVFTLGRCYCAGLQLLGLHAPQACAVDLVDRYVGTVLSEDAAAGAVRRDTRVALSWMEQHLLGRHSPLTALGAAIVIACEMNNVAVSTKHVTSALRMRHDTVVSKLQEARRKLLSFAPLLPYAGRITAKNVGSYAATIFRLSCIMRVPEEEEAEQASVDRLEFRSGRRREERAQLEFRSEGRESAAETSEPSKRPAGEGRSAATGTGGKRVCSTGDAGGVPAAAVTSTAKRRRRNAAPRLPPRAAAAAAAAAASGGGGGAQAEEGGDGGLGSEDDLSDGELAGYLRSEEEVELYTQLYEAARGAG